MKNAVIDRERWDKPYMDSAPQAQSGLKPNIPGVEPMYSPYGLVANLGGLGLKDLPKPHYPYAETLPVVLVSAPDRPVSPISEGN